MFRKKKISEEALIKGCIQNDRHCQEQLYRRFFPKMMEICMCRVRDEDVAITIVNNGFLKVFQKIHQFSFKGSLEGWIRRIVWRSLADYFHKHQKDLKLLILEDQFPPPTQPNAQQLEVQDILKMIEALPSVNAEVFKLHALEGYNHTEIGQKLGFSEGTSKWHLFTARQKLKEMLVAQNKMTIVSAKD